MCDTADSSHPLLPGNRRNHSEQHLKAAVRAACATQARSLLSTPLSTAHLALPSLRPPAGRNRSSAPYDKKRDYPYTQSVEPEIVRALGAVYGPYTGTCFTSQRKSHGKVPLAVAPIIAVAAMASPRLTLSGPNA